MKTNTDNVNIYVFGSIIFHIVIFTMVSVGFPNFAKKLPPIETAIIVEMVDLADISQLNKEPAKPKPVYNKSENAPERVPLKEAKPDINDVPPPPPKDKKPKLDKQIIKNPPKPKNKPRITKPKPAIKAEEPEDSMDFTSLLKSLTPDEPEEQTPIKSPNSQDPISQIADFSKQMTRSEIDDLNRGVQPCWNVNAGGRDAHNLIVELMVFVAQDRSVRDVQIIDTVSYNSDNHFRAAAEAARRALLNPRCSTLNLPPEKYERWKKFRYIFDPSNML